MATPAQNQKTNSTLAIPASTIAKMEQLQTEYAPQKMEALSEIKRTVALAQGIAEIKSVVKEFVPLLRELQGTSLGFRTDRDKDGGYPAEVLTEVATEAILRGFSWTGNEFNIIAGRFYGTREGYTRKVGQYPGLTDLVIIPAVPAMTTSGATVKMTATYRLNDVPKKFEQTFAIRVNAQMGVDAVIGKARRKCLAAIYGILTGSIQTDLEDEDETTDKPALPPTTTDLKNRLKNTQPEQKPEPPKLAEGEIPNEDIPLPPGPNRQREPGEEG